MNKTVSEPEKKSTKSIILNVVIGIVAVSGIIWLVMHCPTCH